MAVSVHEGQRLDKRQMVIIFSRARSGSTLFQASLDLQPDITMYYELFGEDTRSNQQYSALRRSLGYPNRTSVMADIPGFLSALMAQCPTRVCGFKVFDNDITPPATLDQLFVWARRRRARTAAPRRIRSIVLERTNRTAEYLSKQRAFTTGDWSTTPCRRERRPVLVTRRTTVPTYKVSAEQDSQWHDSWFGRVREVARGHGPHLEIRSEFFFGHEVETVEHVLDFLGVAAVPSVPLVDPSISCSSPAEARIRLVSGHALDPVRQDYDYVARAQGFTISRFGHCVAELRKRRVADTLAGNELVTGTSRLPHGAAAVKGSWKKLHAILEGAKHADLIIWHDSDAVPSEHGQLIERVRRIAAEQPTAAIWLQPSGSLLRRLATTPWQDSFGGVSLHSVRSHVNTSNDLQGGVMVVRASNVGLVADALRLYDGRAEAKGQLVEHLISHGVPTALSGLQDQGPLTHTLLQRAKPGQVQLIPWLQCQARLADCQRASAKPAAFVHYAGCSFDRTRARECLQRFCSSKDAASRSATGWAHNVMDWVRERVGVGR